MLSAYTVAEAADLCGVTTQTVRNWLRSGRLRAVYTAGGQRQLVTADSVQAWLRKAAQE